MHVRMAAIHSMLGCNLLRDGLDLQDAAPKKEEAQLYG